LNNKTLCFLFGLLFLIACTDPEYKSSEEKASDLTKSLVKEMEQRDSLEALSADSLDAAKAK